MIENLNKSKQRLDYKLASYGELVDYIKENNDNQLEQIKNRDLYINQLKNDLIKQINKFVDLENLHKKTLKDNAETLENLKQ